MEAGAVFALRLSEKAKTAENIFFPYGRTDCLSNGIVILDRQKGANAKKGEDTMKRIGMFLLGMAAALNVLLVICMVGERMSLRQVMYTFTDRVRDMLYLRNRGWKF